MDGRNASLSALLLPLLLILNACIPLTVVEAFVMPTTTTTYENIQHSSSQLSMASDDDNHNMLADNANADDNAMVMINGMPGPMATAAAEACLRKGLTLAPIGLTGPDMDRATIHVTDLATERAQTVRLIPANAKDEIAAAVAGWREANADKLLLAIDYTHPSAVLGNAQFYVDQRIPFVMGTTGGDRDRLMDIVTDRISCVIAPNMGKQIVAMQAALEYLQDTYPNAFADYKLAVTESHQVTKADTSGTAKAVVDSLKRLNGESTFHYDDIARIRNETQALEWGVPTEAVRTGHAFHRYTLTSADQSVQFALEHNVAGRNIYAEGTADACAFLIAKLVELWNDDKDNGNDKDDKDGQTNVVYSMVDVLKAGALE